LSRERHRVARFQLCAPRRCAFGRRPYSPILRRSGVYRWLGALGLAGFTLIAPFVANRFWEIPQPDRFMIENAFFEHLGLVGALLLVA